MFCMKDWPINGGKDLGTDALTNDLLLTGSVIHVLFSVLQQWQEGIGLPFPGAYCQVWGLIPPVQNLDPQKTFL